MPEDVLNGCFNEAAEFISAVAHKRPPHPTIEEVFPSVELCFEMAQTLNTVGSNENARETLTAEVLHGGIKCSKT